MMIQELFVLLYSKVTSRRARRAGTPPRAVCITVPPQPQSRRSWVVKLSLFESGQHVIHFCHQAKGADEEAQ